MPPQPGGTRRVTTAGGVETNSNRLVDAVRRTISDHQLLPREARVIVAVSGGADSVALLRVLDLLRPVLKLTLRVAHLDHGLREASAGDAAFVRDLAGRLGLPLAVERKDVGAICARQGWSLEEGARDIRYRFLFGVAQHFGASHLAIAHTADDQAETVLMRLMRGTGLLGLSAIPVKRRQEHVWMVRPFLDIWRQDLLVFLQEAGAAYREDATNADTRFVRNRIRRELLPLLEQDYNPNIKVALNQLAQQCASDYACLQETAGRQWKRLVKISDSDQARIVVSKLLRQPKAVQRLIVRKVIELIRGDLRRLEYRHWLEAERLMTERPVGSLLDLPGGVQLRRERAYLMCRRVAISGARGEGS